LRVNKPEKGVLQASSVYSLSQARLGALVVPGTKSRN
jgi:hypothetical protein